MQSVVVRYDVEEDVPLRCQCRAWTVLVFDKLRAECADVVLTGPMPSLLCPVCKTRRLPRQTQATLRSLAKQTWKSGLSADKVDLRDDSLSKRRFDYCVNIPFRYDSRDYFYLPGLAGERTGFRTPIFFRENLQGLLGSGGTMRPVVSNGTRATVSFPNGAIDFGVNPDGVMFTWLGNLESLSPEDQQLLLRSNISSDHSIGSDFYEREIGQ